MEELHNTKHNFFAAGTIEIKGKLTTASGFKALTNSAAIFHLYRVNQAVPVYVSPAFRYNTGGPVPDAAALRASLTLE